MSDGKRLLIYLAITFGLSFLWFFLTMPHGALWEDLSGETQNFVALGMLFPMLSHVITRRITNEGFALTGENSMRLGISFSGGKWRFFLLAAILPLIYTELSNVIALLLDRNLYDPLYYQSLGLDRDELFLFPAAAITSGMIVSFAAFGEEGGWRGYMMPKLIRLMGRGKALVAGGILWGVWHAPLTLRGHNFGTNYAGYPFTGILWMCIFCILIGVLLTFVTEKSDSVWPAVILHSVNNASPGILNGFLNPANSDLRILSMSPHWFGMMAALFLLDVIVLMIWKNQQPSKSM